MFNRIFHSAKYLSWEKILLLLLLPTITWGQQKKDSLGMQHANSVVQQLNKTTHKADSLSQAELARMEHAFNRLSHQIESAKSKGLPVAVYQKKMDSIQQQLSRHLSLTAITDPIKVGNQKLQRKISSTGDTVQRKINHGASVLQKKINDQKSSLDSLGINVKEPIGKVNLPQKNIPGMPSTQLPSVANKPASTTKIPFVIPGMNLPTNQLNLPGLKEVGQVSSEVKKMEKDVSKELSVVNKEAGEIKKDLGQVNTLEKKAGDAKKEVKETLTDKEKLKDAEKNAEKDIEKQAEQSKEVKEVKQQLAQKNPLEQYKDMLADFKKQSGVQQINPKDVSKQSITNPFIGQEDKLKAGMAELDKLRKKYGEVNESTFPLKRIHNSMKGKPFKIRFIPALGFQVLQGKNVGIDLMPYFMYKVSGRIRLGIGFDYRVQHDQQTLISSAQVMGFRVMGDFRVYGSWYFHAEGEWLHFEQNKQATHYLSDPVTKEWSDRFNIGILKTSKISRRLNSMFEVLYYAGDWKNFPQAKNGAIRFGFEYKLGAKKPKVTK